jgi:hypothetical protein
MVNLLKEREYLKEYKELIYLSKPIKINEKVFYRLLIGPFENKDKSHTVARKISAREGFKVKERKMCIEDVQ